MIRGYSTFQVKSADSASRIITGVASTPEVDLMHDIVEPRGAEYTLPVPFLWQHRHDAPIGHVTSASVTRRGIEATIRIAKSDVPGTLKSRLDEAWESIKSGLVRGLSIGFAPIEHEPIRGGGTRFIRWRWLELSAVTIPANSACTVETVKHYDRIALRAPVSMMAPPLPRGAIRLQQPGARLLYSKEYMRLRGSRPLGGR